MAEDKSLRVEVREMLFAWHGVRSAARQSRKGGFTEAELKAIKEQVLHALDETMDVIQVGADKAAEIKKFLQEHL